MHHMRRNIFEVKNVNKGLFYLSCKGLRSGPAQNKTINANTPQKKNSQKTLAANENFKTNLASP